MGVLLFLASGLTRKEIALICRISIARVDCLVKGGKKNLKLKNLVDVVRWAYRTGLLEMPSSFMKSPSPDRRIRPRASQ